MVQALLDSAGQEVLQVGRNDPFYDKKDLSCVYHWNMLWVLIRSGFVWRSEFFSSFSYWLKHDQLDECLTEHCSMSAGWREREGGWGWGWHNWKLWCNHMFRVHTYQGNLIFFKVRELSGNVNPSHAAIRITVNATTAGFFCKKKNFPTPVQVKKIIKNKTGYIQQIYRRLSLTRLCLTRYYHLRRSDSPVPTFFPIYLLQFDYA